MRSIRLIPALCLAGLLATSLTARAEPARNASQAASNALSEIGQGSGAVVGGSVHTLEAAGGLVVTAVKPVGDSVVLVLRGAAEGASEAGEVSVELGRNVAGAASVAVGSTVSVIGQATGWALYQGGQLIAYVPNELGKALLKREKVGG